jgi:hypothetical protein
VQLQTSLITAKERPAGRGHARFVRQ